MNINSVYSDHPVTAAAEHLVKTIKDHLAAGETVLWLLSGGSGIAVVLEVAKQLKGVNLDSLSVALSDERYGPLGHADENWQQLLDAGMSLPGATLYRTLTGDDNAVTTAEKFSTWLVEQLSAADYTIGLFGIGSDGHTAGIKPHSPAVDAATYASYFTGDDFERITMTPLAIRQFDEAVIQASGADKVQTLKTLLHETPNIASQPAQVLKSIPKCTLYTNNKEL